MASCLPTTSSIPPSSSAHDVEERKYKQEPADFEQKQEETKHIVDVSKFTKMVAMSHKLYSCASFKGKADLSKRRKLVHRLRGLYEATNHDQSFEQAVVKAGWKDFRVWLRETNCMRLDSDADQEKLYKALSSHHNAKAIQWTFVEGEELKSAGDELRDLVDLTSELMKTLYDQSEYLGPWNRSKMEEELTHKDSHCIVLRERSNRNALIGYVCFRIEQNVVSVEEDYLEFYVYELMICDKYQRQRYGEYLMSVCECIANAKQCDYIELTVFSANLAALKFYRKQLSYEFDKNELDEYKHDYRILTKILT